MITFLYLIEMDTRQHPTEFDLKSGAEHGYNRIVFVEAKDLLEYASSNKHYRIPTIFTPTVDRFRHSPTKIFDKRNKFQYSSELHLLLMDDVIRYCDNLIEFKAIRNASDVASELLNGTFRYDVPRWEKKL